MRSCFSATIEMRWLGSQIVGGWSAIFALGLTIIPNGQRLVVHRVFMSALVDSTEGSKSSILWSVIVRDIYAETLITALYRVALILLEVAP